MTFDQFGRIFIGSNLYLDGNAIANAIGDEELGLLRDINALVNTIITSISDSTHFVVQSTAGMSIGDTVQQGTDPTTLHSTLITNVIDATHLQVGSTSGFQYASTYTDLANRIIYDKGVLAGILTSFGVPSSSGEELIALVDKVAPLNINFIITPTPENFPAPVTASIVTGTSNIVTLLTTELIADEAESFPSVSFPVFSFNGAFLSGGDATDMTRSISFVILATDTTYSPPRMFVSSTSGLQLGDTIQQGVNSTSILGVVDSTHLSVSSVSGFTPDSTLTTFTG